VYSDGGKNLRSIVVDSNVSPVAQERNEQYDLVKKRAFLNENATSKSELLASYDDSHPALGATEANKRGRNQDGNRTGEGNLSRELGQNPGRGAALRSALRRVDGYDGINAPENQDDLFASTQRAEQWADKKIKESRGKLLSGVPYPELLAAYAVKGSLLIARGVRDLAAWTAEMVRQFGEPIRPHLSQIYEQATADPEDAAQEDNGMEASTGVPFPPSLVELSGYGSSVPLATGRSWKKGRDLKVVLQERVRAAAQAAKFINRQNNSKIYKSAK